MVKKKWTMGLLSLSVALMPMMVTSVLAADTNVKLEYANAMQSTSTNTLGGKIKLTNTSRETISLADITVRYYYTVEQNIPQTMWCDNAGMNSTSGYQTITSNITSTFVTMSNPTDDADTYLEVGFNAGSGELLPNATVEIQLRITNSNWTNYDQANDYSYLSGTEGYTEWENVPLYIKGLLVSGQEPDSAGVINAEVSTNHITYDKNTEVNNEESTLNLILNGNTLDGIKNNGVALTSEDYVLDMAGGLQLTEDYINGLEIGNYELFLDFSAGRDAVVTLEVVDTTDYSFAMILNTVTAEVGEILEMPINIQNIPAGISNADFVLKYDTNQVEILEVAPGEVISNAGESFMSAIHADKGTINVLFNSVSEAEVITKTGSFMTVKIKAKTDLTGSPLSLEKIGSFSDYDLNPLNITFKTK